MTPYEQSIVAGTLGRDVDTVVVTGRPTLSRPIHALLARPDVRVVVVDQHAPRPRGRRECARPANSPGNE